MNINAKQIAKKYNILDVVFKSNFWVLLTLVITSNVLQLQEVGDFGDENCLPLLNLIRSTKLHLTTEPPISCRCCYRAFFFSLSMEI